MAFNIPEITPAQTAALIRNVGYKGPLDQVASRLSPEQITKLRITTRALVNMQAGKRPVKLAKGGYLFAPDELGDPRVKNRMKDNPEFSEFAVDQQDATANKMQQRFAQPEDRMNRTRGYAVGGMQPTVTATNTPPLPPNMQPFNSKGVAFTGTGNDGYGSMTQGPEDFYNSTTNSFGNELPPVSQPINYGSLDSPGDPLTLDAVQPNYNPPPPPRRGGPRGPGTEMGGPPVQIYQPPPLPPVPRGATLTYEDALKDSQAVDQRKRSANEIANRNAALALGPGGVYNIPAGTNVLNELTAGMYNNPPPLPTYSAEYKAANPLGPAMPIPRGPEPQKGFDLFAPIANEPVKPPVKQKPDYDPSTIYISPYTGNKLAYGVRMDGSINRDNSVGVEASDKRREEAYQKALTKYNAQKAALGENFTNQQLKDYNIKIGRENAINNNPNIERGYYDSPEYQKVRDFSGPVNMAVGSNPYFGRFGSSTIAGMTAKAYEAYLNRTGKTSYLQGGADFVQNPQYQAPQFGTDGPDGRLQPITTMPNITKDPDPRPPKVDGTLGTPIDRPISPDLQKRVDSGDMIDGRTLTPAELEQVKVSSGTMRGGMGTFYNMKLNGKSIILTTEQRRAIIAEGRDAFQTSDYDQGQLQSAEGDNNMATPQYQAQAGQTADPAATPEVPLTPVQKLAADQATTMANVYGDPSKVVTPGTVVSTPTGPDTTIAAGTGSVSSTAPSVAIPGATGVATATAPAVEGPKGVMSTSNVTPAVKAATDAMTAATGSVGANSKVIASTDETSAVSNLKTTQGTATLVTNPVQRKIEAGELVTGVADATTAAAFTEQVQAATALPSVKATVQGQLATLMDDFADGKSPVWAAGAMRAANAAMAARGLGASSMAGQAIIQATMEAALPIAQADAQVTAQFEAQNLSNRQQRAMLAAEQRANFMGMEFTQEFQARVQNSARIGDIANMNFTAEQQIALENGRAANTMNLANLSNSQAMVMAEAAALSNLEMTNLSNRQQAAVQNAQNFMQMDMQNLSNEQQTSLFKQQSIIQSLFTDQAATNAASQFNATSDNQTQQFFASLANQTQQFNATQTNAMSQFDADNLSTLQRFNSELENQRDQFNAKNALVIAQANTQWRQNTATIDTAAQNQANMEYAKSINALTSTSIDQIWQRERDLMSFAFTAIESASDRAVQVAVAKLDATSKAELADNMGKGKLFSTLLTGFLGGYTNFAVGK